MLLTGAFGDELYLGSEEWLADLIAEGRLREAWQNLAFYIRYAGPRWTLRAGYLQQLAKRAFHAIPRGKQHLHRRRTALPWLTPIADRLLFQRGTETQIFSERQASLVGLDNALYSSKEIFNASHYFLDLRHPYRDQRLVEFVIAIPAHQLFHRGYYKYILRNAMQGILPEIIRTRPHGTSLGPLFRVGMEREKAAQQACFLDPQAAWRKFVDEKWISRRWNVIPEEDGTEGIVPWLCIAYEAWYQHFVSAL